MKRIIRPLLLLIVAIAVIICGLLALLSSKQASMIYFPRPYGPADVESWDDQPGTTLIRYHTSAGKQQAYLISTSSDPKHLWFFCGGNGTIALDWADWLRKNASPDDAYLLFDMPGYGACSGKPSPGRSRTVLRRSSPLRLRLSTGH